MISIMKSKLASFLSLGKLLQQGPLFYVPNFSFARSTKKNKVIIEKRPITFPKSGENESGGKSSDKPGKENITNESFLNETSTKEGKQKQKEQNMKENGKKAFEQTMKIKEKQMDRFETSKNPSNKNDIIQELKTKRYKFEEKDQNLTVVDLNEKNKVANDPNQEKRIPEKSEPTERLSKYLSRAGVCSRREAEKLLKKGMIYVNNKKVDSNVSVTASSKIKIFTRNGTKAPLKEETKLWMFFKPRGLVCDLNDPENRPNIFQYIKEKKHLKIEHLIAIRLKMKKGRMDFNCEGLVLITNDGELARTLELPETHIHRSYHVRVYGRFTPEKLSKIREGVIIKGKQYGPFWTEILNRQTSNTWLHVKTESGKVREIRRIMQKFDLRVNRIKRVGYGPYKIGALTSGDLVELEIAPKIKKVLYFNVRKKLEQHQKIQKEKLGEKSDLVGISQNKKPTESLINKEKKHTALEKDSSPLKRIDKKESK